MKIVSLLKHDVQILTTDGAVLTIKPSGKIAECRTSEVPVLITEEGFSLVDQKFGPILGLPVPENGVLYLVSTITAQAAAAQGRNDCVSPNSGPSAIRWSKEDAPDLKMIGQVRYVRNLQRF